MCSFCAMNIYGENCRDSSLVGGGDFLSAIYTTNSRQYLVETVITTYTHTLKTFSAVESAFLNTENTPQKNIISSVAALQ